MTGMKKLSGLMFLTVLALVLTFLAGTYGYCAQQSKTKKFPHNYSGEKLMNDRKSAGQFVEDYLKGESRFFARTRNKKTGPYIRRL